MTALGVSVVIPAFNRPEMTARAVRSALGQRPDPPFEVVVVDDCSTDHTGAAARAAGARVIHHAVNRGEGGARNTAIREAQQPWVALLDSDDEWLPGHLAALWPLRDDHVVLGSTAVATCADAPPRLWGRERNTPEALRSPADLLRAGNALVASSVLVRRDLVLAVGGFREDLRMGADLDLWLRVLERGTGLVSPAVTVRYHVHADQVSGDRAALWLAHREIVDTYADRPWHTPALRAHVEGYLLWNELRSGDRATVARCAARLTTDPRRLAGVLDVVSARARMSVRSWRYRRVTARRAGGSASTTASG
ncbi:glycosyltransferase family 2 protein [Solirubrobacter sp. CPCC 204708]|uniref:Glycosyltransferase n=1 Tax=Solirubrobacter deserti TaxID=2282478 RepID=A0ABT4RMJ3_9ACTN|nr:glycosyltransferase family 2 protein [Solirubrobacter deserti]MBE2317969.1 glycosyltransferase family 2 protein [Solirubrobacter deserti]MDA0139648.1 glycosyltransferase [Solirubrobacter deserti]